MASRSARQSRSAPSRWLRWLWPRAFSQRMFVEKSANVALQNRADAFEDVGFGAFRGGRFDGEPASEEEIYENI